MKKIIILIVASFSLLSFSVYQSETYIAKKGYAFAVTEEGYNKMMDATSSGDEAYFQRLIDQSYVVILPNDLEVYLIDSSWSGSVVLRVKGKDLKLWGIRESIRSKY